MLQNEMKRNVLRKTVTQRFETVKKREKEIVKWESERERIGHIQLSFIEALSAESEKQAPQSVVVAVITVNCSYHMLLCFCFCFPFRSFYDIKRKLLFPSFNRRKIMMVITGLAKMMERKFYWSKADKIWHSMMYALISSFQMREIKEKIFSCFCFRCWCCCWCSHIFFSSPLTERFLNFIFHTNWKFSL